MEKVATRWTTQPIWHVAASLIDRSDGGRRLGNGVLDLENSWQLQDLQAKVARYSIERKSVGSSQRKFAQQVLMLTAAGVSLSMDVVEASRKIIEQMPARDVHRMRAIAKTWARRTQGTNRCLIGG